MRTAILVTRKRSEKLAAPQAGGSGPPAETGCKHESRVKPRPGRRRSRSSPSRAVLRPSSRPRSPSVSPERQARLPNKLPNMPPFAVGSAYFSPRPPPAPLRLVVRRPPAPVATLGEQASARAAAQRRRVVKRLLRELVAALPLPTAPAAPSAASVLVTTCMPHVVPPDVRDAAVQAITQSKTESNERHVVYKIDGEEWVGGVRALRDSHVRLVLRQLRHIERLNHALDRAAQSDAAFERTAPVTALRACAPGAAAAPRLPPQRVHVADKL